MGNRVLHAALLLLLLSCTRTTRVSSRYLVSAGEQSGRCPYTWQSGDYWEFLAWAILDDPSSASALSVTAGYAPGELPSPGTVISLPLAPEMEEAVSRRMEAAGLVREATEARLASSGEAAALLERASSADPSWSVPYTNRTVLLLEEGRTEEALRMLDPVSHKTTPAMVLAGISWRNGDTSGALEHLAEALATDSPRPEAVAAAGIAWMVTGQVNRAGTMLRRLLENPDAPSELRVEALKYAILASTVQD
jgi:hypothetical protein